MFGGSLWNAGCIILFIIGLLMGNVSVSAFAIIIFLLGLILKFLIIKEDKTGVKK